MATESQVATFAAVFTEWHRQYNEEPEGYLSHAESDAMPDDDYGTAASRCFVRIAGELGVALCD